MHRLSGIDVGFLLHENRTQNSSIACLVPLRPDGDGPVTLPALRDHIAARLPLLPSFRWRLRSVPLGLHQPVFVNDPDFDLARHVRAVTLTDPDELDRLVIATSRRTLDRRHPLWEVTLVDGLADGRQALVLLFHHVNMDGVGFATTLHVLLNDDIDADVAAASPSEPWRPERPTRWRLVREALADQMRHWRAFPGLVRDTRRGLRAQREHRALSPAPATPSAKIPIGRDYAPSGERVLGWTSLDIEHMRLVRRAGGVTFNDVLMAIVGIALRRYLVARDQLPEPSLVAAVMMSKEPADAPPRQYGNHFANFVTPLYTGTGDPWEQMQAISSHTAEARHRLELVGLDVPERWLQMIPPFVGVPLSRWQGARMRKHPEHVRCSVLVSNLRGYARYRFLGQEVKGVFIAGPVNDNVGIFVDCISRGPHFDVTTIANPTTLAQPRELSALFNQVLDELVERARHEHDHDHDHDHEPTDRPVVAGLTGD